MRTYRPQDNPQRYFTDGQKGLMRMLRQKGWSYQKIADKLHCSRETARRYCLKY